LSFKGIAAALSAVTLAAAVVVLPHSASAQAAPQGLWSTSYTSGQSAADCGKWQLDDNGFCVANDARNGLELGTKFRTSAAVQITGVRIYRADPASLQASLWTSEGTLLARGTFADKSGNGWQDMSFAEPVTIVPGSTYIASYFSPATKYAFQYGYFADEPRTVGPITALKSVDGSPNGVHCYEDAACSVPVRGHRDSSYWVTPLWAGSDDEPTDPPPAGDEEGSPRVAASMPAPSADRVAPGARITVRFSEPVRRSTLDGSTVRLLRLGSARPVRVVLRYDVHRGRLVLDPRSGLRSGTTYRVLIKTGVRDLAGHRLDQDRTRAGAQPATWTFRTRD
jgi:hypothetical protein